MFQSLIDWFDRLGPRLHAAFVEGDRWQLYLDGLLTGGFQLLRVVEPQPPARMLDQPGMRDELRRPMMLLVAARKLPA